jgi:flavorubredoxin
MNTIDLEKPVEISKDIYWVGSSEEALLRRNIYLRVFKGVDTQYTLLIDPGPPADLATLSQKVGEVIGGLNQIDLIFINHQDPDVVYNATHIQKINPRVLTLMTEDTWRLVQFYGLNQSKFRAVEKFANMRAKIKSGQILQFVLTPFCHFRGACMYYDVESRTLFSGDFLGGISTSDLYGDESHWDGVKAFHQLYMPSRAALQYGVQQIRNISPQPLMIAPQHGTIISGEVMELFLSRIEELSVGIDLIQEIGAKQELIINEANEITTAAENLLGTSVIEEIFALFHPDGSYPSLFVIGKGNTIRDIKGDPMEAVDALIQVIFSMCNEEQMDELKDLFKKSFQERELPMISSLEDDERAIFV